MVASSLIRELLDRQDSNLNLEVSYNIHLRKLLLINFLTGDDIWQQRRIDERFAASFIAEIQTPVPRRDRSKWNTDRIFSQD